MFKYAPLAGPGSWLSRLYSHLSLKLAAGGLACGAACPFCFVEARLTATEASTVPTASMVSTGTSLLVVSNVELKASKRRRDHDLFCELQRRTESGQNKLKE